MRLVFGSLGVLAALACQRVGAAAQTTPAPLIAESRQLLADLVGINTAEPDGNTTTAATLAPDGRYIGYGVQAGEKLYADFTLEATHDGGHSSRP